ncbi:Tsr2p Ecym_7033 [Eremothecium cymbalariae DBVPG|uniref:Pre-rRNA-processing protein TSR2 n=1 Tax=Eremothecium cymbalariae (strain CBS 270.75 / DBVPG 7215 / KCTC 17166 / NRRL Y-17582) TaxID=931890 RepID=G8JVM5_ERECY|nr:hypothetical protein Ecym_7033 [Eremothecium cymbalariae DBVPG\
MSVSVSYDVTEYVEALKGHNNLLFKDEKQQARFELGVSMMIYKWDALDIAVVNGWGGADSADKRDWVTSIVVGLFKSEKIVDVALIEETLLYAMADEFDTTVEDDSALPIAAGILALYKQCDALDYSEVERLYSEWQAKGMRGKHSRKVDIQEDPLNPDVSDSEECVDSDSDVVMECEDDHDKEQKDEEGQSKPVIDEDGFELVQSGKRRY